MRKSLISCLCLSGALLFASAAFASQSETVVQGRHAIEGLVIGQPAADSRLAALEIGMPRTEVETVMGKPDAVKVLDTGLISLYFGGFEWLTECRYAGEGKLRFNRSGHLIQIDASLAAR